MKKVLVNSVALFLLVILFSCEEKDCCVIGERSGDNVITGSWLLYERGYSPGFGYVVEPVAPIPPQTLTLRTNGEMSTTIIGLTEYKFFFVQDDVAPESKIIAFFKSDPGPSPDPSTFTNSYNVTFNGSEIKLSFRYCFEGCHLGLKKLE